MGCFLSVGDPEFQCASMSIADVWLSSMLDSEDLMNNWICYDLVGVAQTEPGSLDDNTFLLPNVLSQGGPLVY